MVFKNQSPKIFFQFNRCRVRSLAAREDQLRPGLRGGNRRGQGSPLPSGRAQRGPEPPNQSRGRKRKGSLRYLECYLRIRVQGYFFNMGLFLYFDCRAFTNNDRTP